MMRPVRRSLSRSTARGGWPAIATERAKPPLPLITDKEALFKNIQILIQAAKILEIPILWCQQVPQALGPTVPEIATLLAGGEPINKASFSCCGQEQFNAQLNTLGKEQVLLCGIETHVCI